MTLTAKYRDDAGDLVEIIDSIDRTTIELTENAEEGSVGISHVRIDDPEVAIAIRGHRAFVVAESEIDSGETAFFRGYTADRTYTALDGVSVMGRQIELNVADVNSVFARRISIGRDGRRKAETDIERVLWAASTNEAGLIDSTALVSSANPKNMDKVDYRREQMDRIYADCAEASGKNWGLTYDFSNGQGFTLFYARSGASLYDSGCLLTNDESLVDHDTVFAISNDTKIMVNPERVWSGVGVEYEKGFVYRQNATTAHTFARRDTVMRAPHVKTKAKAIDRSQGWLGRHNEEDIRIETTIYVSPAKLNRIRPFHRVRFQSFLAPETMDPVWCRVVKRTVKYFTEGLWALTLTLAGGAAAEAPPVCSTSLSGSIARVVQNQAYAAGAVQMDITPADGEPVVVVAAAQAANHHTPPDSDITPGEDWTEIFGSNATPGAPTTTGFYQGVETPSGAVSVDASYTPGYQAATLSKWGVVAAAIRTSTLTPVQVKGHHSTLGGSAVFDDPPTPGNLITMSVGVRDAEDLSGNLTPPMGTWTVLGEALQEKPGFFGHDLLGLYARCVQEGDGSSYGIAGLSKDVSICIAEWEIS